VYKTQICDIYDLQKRLMQTWVDFEQKVIDAVTLSSEVLCACWWRTVWTHAVPILFICSMWFIWTFCETVNV